MFRNYVAILIVSIFLVGCAGKPPMRILEEVVEEATEPEEPETVEEVIPDKLDVVYFEFDKYSISPVVVESNSINTIDILSKNAKWLKEHPDIEIIVEGYCCECGPAQYNMELGKKRADSVKNYYGTFISTGRITTVSFGESKSIYPDCCPDECSTEGAYNRRVETIIKK